MILFLLLLQGGDLNSVYRGGQGGKVEEKSLKKKQRKDKGMVSCGSKNTESYKMEVDTDRRKLESL